MSDFHTLSEKILLFLEADLPEPDGQDEETEEGDSPELPGADGADDGADQAEPPVEAAPPAPAVELASPRECMYTDTILRALMFDYQKVPVKALVVYDMTNPEQILHIVQKITGGKSTAKQFDKPSDANTPAVSGEPPEPMLHRQKQMLAQMMLKALKYDHKQMTIDSSLSADKVTPENAKQLQKELSVLLAV